MKFRIIVIVIVSIALGIISTLMIRSCEAPPSKGKELYEQYCGKSCHGIDGQSILPQIIPPLANSDYLDANADRIACIIYYGLKGEIHVNGKLYNQPMPGNSQLNEIDIANIANYVYRNWSKEKREFKQIDIQNQLEKCE